MKYKFKTRLNFKNKIIVTDGMIGGGKTLIVNLISGLKDIDPWIYDSNIERVCSLNAIKKIDLETSADFLKKNLNEKYFDNFILRHVNFRKQDLSSVVNNIRFKNIKKRKHLSDAAAEKKIKKTKMCLQYMTHQNSPYSEPIFKAYGKQLFYVLILRNPFNIYTINCLARWTKLFSAFDARDGRINFYSNKHKLNFPFEIKKNEIDFYHKLNKYEKSIFFMEYYYYISVKKIIQFSKKYGSNYIIVPFENLTKNPEKYLKKISKILKAKIDKFTIKNMKKNSVPRNNPEQKIISLVYNFSENLPKGSKNLGKKNLSDNDLKKMKYKFLKNKVNDKFLKKIIELEKFYVKKILLKY